MKRSLPTFLDEIKCVNENAVIFKSTQMVKIDKINHSAADLEELSNKILTENANATETELTKVLIEKLSISNDTIKYIEYNTRNQLKNILWFNMRRERLTASKHHDVYTKINTLAKTTLTVKPKTTPLVSRILNPQMSVNTPAIKWGIDHEEDALKAFYAENISKHVDFKTEKSGLFISSDKPFIAASPDGFMVCKCHGMLPLEIKMPV